MKIFYVRAVIIFTESQAFQFIYHQSLQIKYDHDCMMCFRPLLNMQSHGHVAYYKLVATNNIQLRILIA